MRMTPFQIGLLMHHHVSPSMYEPDCRILEDQMEILRGYSLLAKRMAPVKGDDSPYLITGKGKAHVEQILRLPLPRSVWVTAAGKTIPGETGE